MRVVLFVLALASPLPLWAQTVPEELSLKQALVLGVERNPTLAAARDGVSAAIGGALTASLRPNPAVTLETSGRSFLSRAPAVDQHELFVRIDQDLDIAGGRRLRTAVAEQGVSIARADLANVQRDLEFAVRRAYYGVVLAAADRQAAQDALVEIDRVIELNRARLQHGEISGAELRRVQVERLKFQDDVFSSELAARNSRSALLALLNVPDLGQSLRATDALTSIDPAASAAVAAATSLSGGSLPGAMLSQRPDVTAARLGSQQANTATRLQQALRLPSPTIGGGYRHEGGQASAIVGMTLPLPFFNRNQGEIARARAEEERAQHVTQAAERAAALEIQQAVNAVEVSRERVTYIEREHLTSARESRDVILASYRLGAANLIDFLDAQRAYRDTLRTYNQALFEQRLSGAALVAALGLESK